ncbi:BZ3501_MvSof-1269-A2-R1_Chr12-3g03646 [Microbotryum saponariae]|nr:BZ3501_MvSof-1269-A2-R1_Chr12-3g03646 [Microbotryum saponariae]
MLDFNPTKLRQWLLQQLEPMQVNFDWWFSVVLYGARELIGQLLDANSSDADPHVLAEYVLALLKHGAPFEQLKKHCASQLQEFLGPQTSAFISRLFFYLTSASTSSTKPDGPVPFSSSSSAVAASETQARGPRGTKRSQLSRSNASQLEVAANRIQPEPRTAAAGWAPSSNLSPSPLTPWPSTNPGPLLCEAYHRYGFCPRSLMCIYLHDVRGDAGALPPSKRAPQDPAVCPHQLLMPASAAACPLGAPPIAPIHTKRQRPTESIVYDRVAEPGSGRERKRRALVPPLSTCAIRIENIPSDKVDQDDVVECFSRFGDISSAEVNAAYRRAVVIYHAPAQAELALNSPDAVLGNRFVRVYRMPADTHHSSSDVRIGFSPLPSDPWERVPHLAASGAGSTALFTPSVMADHLARLHIAVRLEKNAAEQKRLLEKVGACSDRAEKAALTKKLRLASTKGAMLRTESERAEQAVKGDLELARLRAELSGSMLVRKMLYYAMMAMEEQVRRSEDEDRIVGGHGAVRISAGIASTTVRKACALERHGIVTSMEAIPELTNPPSYIVESESIMEAERIMIHSSELKSEFMGLELSWR